MLRTEHRTERRHASRNPWWSKGFMAAHLRIYQGTDGRLGHRVAHHRTLLITTTGRRTGLLRTQALTYVRTGGELVVVASNWGNDYLPAWYHNLVANPRVRIRLKREVFDAEAVVADPETRARLWPHVVARQNVFGRYQAGTPRMIPLVLLRRV